MAFEPDPEKIRLLHRRYFNQDPTRTQGRLYDAFPRALGYSDPHEDSERFQAVLHVALVLAIPPDGDITHTQATYIFYPKPAEPFVVGRIRAHAEAIFARLRQEHRVEAARFLGECFKALRLGHRVLQFDETPPDRWVAFGFDRQSPVPSWLTEKLLVDPDEPH